LNVFIDISVTRLQELSCVGGKLHHVNTGPMGLLNPLSPNPRLMTVEIQEKRGCGWNDVLFVATDVIN